MKTILSSLIGIFLCLSLHAQVPGYMGKRFLLHAKGWSMRAVAGPTASNQGNNFYGQEAGSGPQLNFRYGLHAGFVTSRTAMVTLGAEQLKTGMKMTAYTPELGTVDPLTSDFDQHNLFYHLDGWQTSLGMKWFNTAKGALAPMGAYTGLSVDATFVTGSVQDKQTFFAESAAVNHRNLGIDPSFTYWSLTYEFGFNYIIADQLVLNLSGQVAIPLQAGRYLEELDSAFGQTTVSFEEDYLAYNQDAFGDGVTTRLAGHNFFMIGIGLGYLIF